ncbi:MAG: oxidoreductase, 2OG-Fe(II) oxygenase [Cyclobacteriaceae bacterium]|nr:oxidoreductase, 2OG-Fe(II) oxygenase [Cyclobacteriaceae bacterium]
MQLIRHTPNIFTIDSFWTKKQCEDFIAKSESIGYEPATVTTENGDIIVKEVRNNNRVIYQDIALAESLWQEAKPFAPTKFGNSLAVGLNELFRFYKYLPGQQFKKHRDQSFIRNDREASYFTFMIYLNDGYEGGETTFNDLIIQPQQGTALIFQHDLEHECASVTQGVKYVLRTDIMFQLQDSE